MRAPFQILALPYKMVDGEPRFCVFHRADHDQWQFISGGGEDAETPYEAAIREIWEESGIRVDSLLQLSSLAYIPTFIFSEKYRKNWPADTYVIPEYAFAFQWDGEIQLSLEHTDFRWLPYEHARETLRWDSNRTALYELYMRITA